MNHHYLEILLRLFLALLAGASIGYERSYAGRPAGFRTHALVCAASCLLMFVTVYEESWVTAAKESIRLDPTRMGQGIMTGIGFLGAGVIIREGATVRGLTTAASIWMTASIGILAGVGLYFPFALSVVATLGILVTFRSLERKMPAQSFYIFEILFSLEANINESDLIKIVEGAGFSVGNFSYQLDCRHKIQRHSMTLRTLDRRNASKLFTALEANQSVLKLKLIPTSDK